MLLYFGFQDSFFTETVFRPWFYVKISNVYCPLLNEDKCYWQVWRDTIVRPLH